MAKIGDLRLNTSSQGEWVLVDGSITFEVKVRGTGPEYQDYYNALLRAAARRANRASAPGTPAYSPDDLPPSLADQCTAQAVADKMLVDVRGLEHDDGRPVSVAELREMLVDPDWKMLASLVLQAGFKVTAGIATEREQAEGNLKPASAGI